MSEGVPFRLNKYMSGTRFEVIISSLCYTDRDDVEYNNGFFQMCQMEEAWNRNITDEFNPSWINVLGESII